MTIPYAVLQPERADVDAMDLVAIEFGVDWCGFCRAGAPHIAAALAEHPDVPHLKVEDGSGRKLGRSFKVKLWPTLVLVRKGEEVARVVRPDDAAEVMAALAQGVDSR
jgi:thioredoxin 1